MWGGKFTLCDPFKYFFLKFKNTNNPATDNWIYALHRRWSYLVLLMCLIVSACSAVMLKSTLACMIQGDPEVTSIPEDFLEYYCWIAGTFIVKEHINGTIGKDVAHPGIGPDVNLTRIYYLQYLKYHLIILIQFCLFRISKNMWRRLEGNQLKSLIQELKLSETDQEETLKKASRRVADYMTSPMTFHNAYAYKYAMCEMFNAVNVVFQFWMLNSQLHQEFITFGWDAVQYIKAVSAGTQQQLVDPFVKLFPKVTKCEFKYSGPGGNWISYEAICVMPLHAVVEKIFLVIWFWLIAVGFLTVVGLVYRVCVVCSCNLRYIVIRVRVRKYFLEPCKLRYFVNNSTYGLWFVISHLEKRLPAYSFSRLVLELVEKLQETEGKIYKKL